MTNEKPIYEKQDNESSAWFAKYLIYRNEKPARRSLLGAYGKYQTQVQNSLEKHYKQPPGSWKQAFEKYDWKRRAEAYDAKLQAEQEERERVLREIEAAEIERIMTTGYAAVHERVKGLDEMARLIKKSWLNDEGEIVYQWLSPDKVREYRGCLDDIAKELGQRVKTEKRELSGSIEFKTEWGGGVLDTDDEA